jgi:hypothetical protein
MNVKNQTEATKKNKKNNKKNGNKAIKFALHDWQRRSNTATKRSRNSRQTPDSHELSELTLECA